MQFTTFALASLATVAVTALNARQTDCMTSYNACRTATDANFSECASEYASCLGYNPFASNGTNTVTAAVSYTTTVVTAFTTYCPSATTLTYNNQTYVATGATTLTVTDCPCTLTAAISSGAGATAPAKNGSATATPISVSGSATASGAAQYTGSADINKPAFGALALGALGAFAFL